MLQKCIEVLLYVRQKKFFSFLRCCCQKRHASFAWKWVNDTFFNWWCDLWNRVSRGLKNTRAWFLDFISKHVAMHLTCSMSRICVFLLWNLKGDNYPMLQSWQYVLWWSKMLRGCSKVRRQCLSEGTKNLSKSTKYGHRRRRRQLYRFSFLKILFKQIIHVSV